MFDHVTLFQDMTSIVRRLSRDMERCEGAVSSNTAAINNLSARLAALETGGSVSSDLDTRINRFQIFEIFRFLHIFISVNLQI